MNQPALHKVTSSPSEPLLLRRTAEQSLAVACKFCAAVRRRRGGAKNFIRDSTNYNTTDPQVWTLTAVSDWSSWKNVSTTTDPQVWTLTAVSDWSSWKNVSTTAATRTHGAAHELTRIGSGTTPATIFYDTKGNITQNQRRLSTSSIYQNYVWDFDNRMISADTNVDTTAEVTFRYAPQPLEPTSEPWDYCDHEEVFGPQMTKNCYCRPETVLGQPIDQNELINGARRHIFVGESLDPWVQYKNLSAKECYQISHRRRREICE